MIWVLLQSESLIIFFKKNTNSAFEITHKYIFRKFVIE